MIMMMKSLSAILLMSLALSASAANLMGGPETQILEFHFTSIPSSPGEFYCEVQPNVQSVTVMASNQTITGCRIGVCVFDGPNTSSILNQLYFTAQDSTFTGAGYSVINIVYSGSKDDVQCYNGKGNRTTEYTG